MARARDAPKDSTLEVGESTLERTVQLEEEQDRMETYSHHSEPQPVLDGFSKSERRMVVARPVVEAWQSATGAATFAEEVETVVQPQNLIVGAHGGARRGADGQVLSYTILGNPEDFSERAPPPEPEEMDNMSFQPPEEDYEEEGSEYGSSMSKSPGQSMRSRGSRRGSMSSAKSGRSARSMRSAKSGAGRSQHGGSQRGSVKGSQKSSNRGGNYTEPEGEEKSYYERSADERQMRALERYAEFEADRNRLYERFMEGRKKMPGSSVPVMFTGDEFRERREEYDLVDKAQPREEKFADGLWFMSLRDSWCRYIPLGSIFSGLFCKVREKDISEKAFTIVRNPRARQGAMVNTKLQTGFTRDGKPYKYHTKNPPESIPKLSWVQDPHLWAVQKHLKKSIHTLLPFRSDSEGLEVIGSDIWCDEQGLKQAQAREAEEDAEEEDKAWDKMSDRSKAKSKKGGEDAHVSGPAVEFLEHHLAFETGPDKVGSQKLPVQNTGTCAIYYKWHKAQATNKLGVPLRGIDPPGGGFYAVEEEGVLLPGNTIEFSFAFKSKLCGIYTASFHMTTVPPVAEGSDLSVTMRGVVTEPEEHAVKRSLLEAHLEHNSVIHGIQDILMEAIRAVELPPPAAGAEDQPQDESKTDAKTFAKANTEILIKGDVPCVTQQTVFYEKHLLKEMRDLATTATSLPQLSDVPAREPTPDAREAFIKTLTPRDAVYDPSLEKDEPDEGQTESWDEGWSWSHTVLDLGTRQLGIVSERQRADELGKLDALVERAVFHGHRPNPLYPPALDALSELAENIESTADQARRRMGLPPKNFVDPDDAEANDPKGKGAPEEVEVDEELEKDFHDTLYLKVRALLCNAVDQFADLAAVVMVDEAERRGEDVEDDE